MLLFCRLWNRHAHSLKNYLLRTVEGKSVKDPRFEKGGVNFVKTRPFIRCLSSNVARSASLIVVFAVGTKGSSGKVNDSG
jgi:hypothetical protein